MEKFGKLAFGLFTIVVESIVNGFVFTKLWLWFIVPVFNTIELKLIESIGLLFLFSFLKINKRDLIGDSLPTKKLVEMFFTSIIMSFVMLLFSWIVYLFM